MKLMRCNKGHLTEVGASLRHNACTVCIADFYAEQFPLREEDREPVLAAYRLGGMPAARPVAADVSCVAPAVQKALSVLGSEEPLSSAEQAIIKEIEDA